jgi:hypothetical protein
MKKSKLKSALSFIAISLLLIYGMSSCTKTNTVTKIVTDTVTVIQKDTLQEKDTTLTAAILTANPWKISVVRATVGGYYVYYQRGGSNNTQNFDNEYMTFNANNTGTYTDNTGVQTSFTWNFTDVAHTNLVWVWNLSSPVTVTWENIAYDNASIRYTEYYYTQFGGNTLSSCVRIPK